MTTRIAVPPGARSTSKSSQAHEVLNTLAKAIYNKEINRCYGKRQVVVANMRGETVHIFLPSETYFDGVMVYNGLNAFTEKFVSMVTHDRKNGVLVSVFFETQ